MALAAPPTAAGPADGLEAACRARHGAVLERVAAAGGSVEVARCCDLSDVELDEALAAIDAAVVQGERDTRAAKRAFRVSVELLQNVREHASMDAGGRRLGFAVLARDGLGFVIHVASLASDSDVRIIREKLALMEGCEPDELARERRRILSEGSLSAKGGAGLGLLSVAIWSDGALDASFTPIGDGLTLYEMRVAVSARPPSH